MCSVSQMTAGVASVAISICKHLWKCFQCDRTVTHYKTAESLKCILCRHQTVCCSVCVCVCVYMYRCMCLCATGKGKKLISTGRNVFAGKGWMEGVSVYVCVCVCVRERGKHRARAVAADSCCSTSLWAKQLQMRGKETSETSRQVQTWCDGRGGVGVVGGCRHGDRGQ